MSLTQSWFLLTQMMRRRSLEDTRTVDLIEGKMLLLVTIGWDSFSFFWEVLMWSNSEAAARVSGAAETVDYFG